MSIDLSCFFDKLRDPKKVTWLFTVRGLKLIEEYVVLYAESNRLGGLWLNCFGNEDWGYR